MSASSPSLKDLATVLYRPRETFRDVLAHTRRWTPELVVLAAICTSVADTDTHQLSRALPTLSLGSTLALIALVLVATACMWILFVFLCAPVVTLCGRWLGGEGTFADVRAALAWGMVPLIWSLPFRAFLFFKRPPIQVGEAHARVAFDFMANGGCTMAIFAAALQFLFDAWVAYVAACCVGEALRFSSWKGLGALAMTVAVPVVIAVAAVLAFKG